MNGTVKGVANNDNTTIGLAINSSEQQDQLPRILTQQNQPTGFVSFGPCKRHIRIRQVRTRYEPNAALRTFILVRWRASFGPGTNGTQRQIRKRAQSLTMVGVQILTCPTSQQPVCPATTKPVSSTCQNLQTQRYKGNTILILTLFAILWIHESYHSYIRPVPFEFSFFPFFFLLLNISLCLTI